METYSEETLLRVWEELIVTANTRKVHRLYQTTTAGSKASMSLSFKVDGMMQGVFSINIKRVGL
jgi:hypothetical protein